MEFEPSKPTFMSKTPNPHPHPSPALVQVLSPETDTFKGQEDYTEGIDGKFTAKDIDAYPKP